jgi:hypothetical protein
VDSSEQTNAAADLSRETQARGPPRAQMGSCTRDVRDSVGASGNTRVSGETVQLVSSPAAREISIGS